MGVETALELAASQHGVVAVWQLRDLGMTRQQIHRLRRDRHWDRVHRSVFRHVAAPRCDSQSVAAGVLSVGGGGFLSHESAAAWWGHPGCRLLDPLQVTTTSRRKPGPDSLRAFHTHRCDPRWVVRHSGVPTARPEFVAMQLFAILSFGRAERIVDRLWSMRLFDGRSLARLLGDLGRRGRNGTAGLRAYLHARGVDYRPPDSGLESRVEHILGKAGIPLRRQVDLGGDDRWNARVDFLHESLPLVVEVQSELYHSSLTDREADRSRIAALEARGFRVVEVTDQQVWTRPGVVVSAVRAEIGALRRAIGDERR